MVHAPFGAKRNRAWGMALRKQICRAFEFELQASATDDGLCFSLGPNLSFPLSEVFTYLWSKTVENVLRQAVLQSPIFGTRWRWTVTRSLAVLRHNSGKKVPAPLVRMRSDDLLAAVFPAQVACQDNTPGGDVEIPDNPLIFETMRDCLTDAMDSEGLSELLALVEQGEIEVHARDTVQPSVFSHQLLNAMPYAFLDDAPLEERRARAVPLRRALPEDARDLASLDAAAVQEGGRNAWPRIRDADELHDALLVLGLVPETALLPGVTDQYMSGPSAEEVRSWLTQLADAGRAYVLDCPHAGPAWVAAERVDLVRSALGRPALALPLADDRDGAATLAEEEAVLTLLRGWVECSGPFTVAGLADTLGLDGQDVAFAVARLESEGLVLRGQFTPGTGEEEFCDRRILARIHRATVGRLRREIEPVSPAEFLRFLFRWQHLEPGSRLQGEGGALEAVEMLQGFEVAAGALETEVLAARVLDYKPVFLDQLCLGGEVVWGRMSGSRTTQLRDGSNSGSANGSSPKGALTKSTPITIALRESLGWLLDSPNHDGGPVAGDGAFSGASREIMEFLSRRGASFLTEIISSTRRLPSDVEEAIWQLAAAGRVTADGMESLRQRTNGKAVRSRRPAGPGRVTRQRRPSYSRWSVLETISASPEPVEQKARQLLRRYGVIFPELMAREPVATRWRELLPVLRRLEARGEIRGGRFISGFIGEQFALPEAVSELRASKNRQPSGEYVVVSACDPLNLSGILTPGEKVPAVLGNRVVFREGIPLCSLESGNLVDHRKADNETASDFLKQARALLDPWGTLQAGNQVRSPLKLRSAPALRPRAWEQAGLVQSP